ncbi:PREDICTED: mitochondrial import inner membrane translocase subunit Tim8 [Dinoponera quadriceps]|uniref:Mitochondrial import inner membrane translocase subunit n=1 Tax=Dinoponera quadriceps TaxID=609295 RepID=A0A6P3Y622_DINQU|nr:PREDICTED: mitochondrial import inner membrane translocase subunit Tim8 [Dinoponera quadriceps]
MSDTFDNDFSNTSSDVNTDSQLNELLNIEKEKVVTTAQIHAFNDICWETCVDKPGSKLGGRTETCISNCVNRFIDVSYFITNRFAQLLQNSIRN